MKNNNADSLSKHYKQNNKMKKKTMIYKYNASCQAQLDTETHKTQTGYIRYWLYLAGYKT